MGAFYRRPEGEINRRQIKLAGFQLADLFKRFWEFNPLDHAFSAHIRRLRFALAVIASAQ